MLLPDWKSPDVKYRTDELEGDCVLPDVITPDYGIGVTFKDDKGVEYTTITEGKREIRVSVDSWKGIISMDAVHYYAKIQIHSPSLSYIEDGKPTISNISGAFNRHKPVEARDIGITVLRVLEEKEKKEGTKYDGNRWDGYKVGALINAFESQVELYNAIVSLLQARFAGDWQVDIDGFDSDRYNKLEISLSELKSV